MIVVGFDKQMMRGIAAISNAPCETHSGEDGLAEALDGCQFGDCKRRALAAGFRAAESRRAA